MTSKTTTITQEALKFPVFPPRYDMQNWLYLCWEGGRLRFFDPETGSYLRSHQEEVARADEERARAEAEAEARREAEAEVRRLREQLRELGEGR